MDNKYKRLVKNTLWILVGNTGSKVLAFLLLPFYTRWLGTEGYGLSDLIGTYSSMLIGLITLCTADGIFVFTKNRSSDEQREYYSSALVFTFALFLIWIAVMAGTSFVCQQLDIRNSFIDNIWFVMGVVLSTFLQNYTQQFVISLEKMKVYSLTGIILCLTTFVLSFLLIPQYGVYGYIMSLVLSNILTAAYSFIFSKSWRYLRFRSFRFNRAKELLAYSIPLIPNSIMWWLVQALNRPIMESELGYSAIGIYAVANKFPGIVTMIFSLFAISWNISVFEEYKKPGFETFYTKIFRAIFFVITCGTIVLCLCSQLMVTLFAAPEFMEAWKYMVILMIGAMIACLSSFWGTMFAVVKQSKYFFYSSVWGAVVSIVANFLLIPTMGLYGACFSVVISYMAMALSRYMYSRKFIVAKLLKVSVSYVGTLFFVGAVIIVADNALLKVLASLAGIVAMLLSERESCKVLIEKVRNRYGKN